MPIERPLWFPATAIEVLGKYPGGPIAGLMADAFGYMPVFITGTVLSVLFLLPLYLVSRAPRSGSVAG